MTRATDERLVLEYLYYRVFKRNAALEYAYVEPGSDRELECLAALGRLLRGEQFNRATLLWLADGVEARQLRLVRRRAGGPNYPSDARKADIAVCVAVNAGKQIKCGILLAMERYGVSESTATRAWAAHMPVWFANGAAFHQMQLELEQTKRENSRLAKQIDDLTRQMHLLKCQNPA